MQNKMNEEHRKKISEAMKRKWQTRKSSCQMMAAETPHMITTIIMYTLMVEESSYSTEQKYKMLLDFLHSCQKVIP